MNFSRIIRGRTSIKANRPRKVAADYFSGFTIAVCRCYQRGCNPHVCELKQGCKYVNEQFMVRASDGEAVPLRCCGPR